MAKIIAFANQKGGVGKTTSCVNLCAALTLSGKRVLLVDCDPQGNASSGMGVKKSRTPNIYDMLIHDVPSEDCVVHTDFGDVIPSGRELAAATVELSEKPGATIRSGMMPNMDMHRSIFSTAAATADATGRVRQYAVTLFEPEAGAFFSVMMPVLLL